MKASAKEVLIVLPFTGDSGKVRVRRVAKLTGLSEATVRDAFSQIHAAERLRECLVARLEKYSALITFQRPIRDQERGRSRGAVGTSTSDRSPTPQGLPLLRFVAILTEGPQPFVSERLPMCQWTEG